jgi:N-acetylmuramoyl-L-alanine amidase
MKTMAKLCFDYGHGGSDSGACYNGRKESMDVLIIGREVAAEVRRHGVTVDETRTTDATVSLQQRCDFEHRQSYDYFISFHRNAFSPEKATGVETYTYLNPGTKSQSLAGRIQNALVSLGFVNRGVKQANYQVLRETKAPAVLIEMGFIDNTNDNRLFDSKRNEIIQELAKAILAEVGLNYADPVAAPQPANGATLYRVMAGSFSDKANAEQQVQKLKAAGFDATIMAFNK